MVVEGLIMPWQHSNMPEGILLELNNNNKSQRQDGECDFVCVLLKVQKMGGGGKEEKLLLEHY